MTPLRQRMVDETRVRNDVDNTVERYVDSVESFARYFHRSPDRMGPEQIRQYLLHLIEDRNALPTRFRFTGPHSGFSTSERWAGDGSTSKSPEHEDTPCCPRC